MKRKEIYIEQIMLEKLVGTINEEDSFYLNALLENDEKTRHRWKQLKEIFETGEPHRYLQQLDSGAAWENVKKSIAEKKPRSSFPVHKLAIAALLLLSLSLATIFYFYSGEPALIAKTDNPGRNVKLYLNGAEEINLSRHAASTELLELKNVKLKIAADSISFVALPGQANDGLNTLVIPETKTYKLTLQDGTEIWLNSMSQLKFPFAFSQTKREVWLDGEARFKVMKNASRPFIVHTPLTEIKVLGTEFNVNTYDSLSVETALVEGSVSTKTKGGKDLLLKSGYKAVYTQGKEFSVMSFNNKNELSWIRGIYYFQNAPVQNIAKVIHRWYGDTLIFDDAKVSSIRFTGALLKNKPLKEFLDNLTLTSNIQYHSKGNMIYLSSY